MDKRIKQHDGMTLIALAVTMVILLILAGVSLLLLLGEDRIIARTKQAKEITYIGVAKEAVSMGWTLCDMHYNTSADGLEKQAYFEKNIKQYIDEQNKNGSYLESDSSIYVAETSIVKYLYKDNVYTFNVDKNGNVAYVGKKNQDSKKDDIPRVEIPNSEYKLVGDVYCNSPDLSGFARDATYYVTYDDSGNETVAGRIDTIKAPDNWYDYSENVKRWANVVTITDEQIAYWVWIPKYVYSLDTTNESVNTCFVTKDTTESTTEYNYKTKDGNKTVSAREYQMPESFKFGEQNLAGIWVNKYEISESHNIYSEEMQYSIVYDDMTITTDNPSGDYDIYIDGDKKYTGALPYIVKIKEDTEDTEYDICIISKTKGPIGRQKVKKSDIEVEFPEVDLSGLEVDLSGFNKEFTYYVLYSEDGQTVESENVPISQTLTEAQKEKWYNYTDKRWANIRTTSKDGSKIAYWTWIPRYEYNLIKASKQIIIKYIKKTQTVADKGYVIPESFTFGGQNLAGIWVSKYEISQ